MVHIVCCVITMSRIISRCAQHFIAQVISNVIKVILITTKYSYKTYFGHILINSQPFLMVQGRKLMKICVEMWSNTGFHERPVFHRSYDIFENWATGNRTEKDRSINRPLVRS